LSSKYETVFSDKNKILVLEQKFPDARVTGKGNISFFRSRAMPMPSTFAPDKPCSVAINEGAFGYERDDGVDHCGRLLAQDEHQVLEHPTLALLKSAIGSEALTREHYNGSCTPCLFTDVPRDFIVETLKSGLYGNNFTKASKAKVLAATTVLNPPTLSNILAIEAPSGGRGSYLRREIDDILSTCFTGFKAACIISKKMERKAIVHTGHLGCGAYGGNKELMTILQIFCATLSEVDLVYHTFGQSGPVHTGEKKCKELIANSGGQLETMKTLIFNCNYQWGVSDGN